jgi:hypothetical protein
MLRSRKAETQIDGRGAGVVRTPTGPLLDLERDRFSTSNGTASRPRTGPLLDLEARRARWRYPAAMADPRRVELEDLVNRPGTYFNPQTEVLIVVDDSPELDGEIFNMEEYEGADWVLISEESPIDESRRDELLEAFQVRYHPGGVSDNEDEEPDELEEDDQDVGRE